MARQVDEIHRMLMRDFPMAKESFEQLKEAVAKAADVKQAAIVLINKMGERLTEMAQHQPTPAELQALAAELKQHGEALASAISEHDT